MVWIVGLVMGLLPGGYKYACMSLVRDVESPVCHVLTSLMKLLCRTAVRTYIGFVQQTYLSTFMMVAERSFKW